MTPLPDVIDHAAKRLVSALDDRAPCRPVRDLLGKTDVDQAYLVQQKVVDAQIAAGARPVGRKIGLTSAAVQAQLGVDQPDFGTLLDTMVVGPDGQVPAGRLLQPRIEAEIAFVLAADLGSPDPTLAEVSAAIRGARAALEIVDSRVADWDICITDTVADNASSGLFVLGEREVSLDEFLPVSATMEMHRDGELVSTGTGADCLGDPLAAVQWLARTAASLGRPLRAGEIILSGALGPMVSVAAGELYTAQVTGLGQVHARFPTDDRRSAS